MTETGTWLELTLHADGSLTLAEPLPEHITVHNEVIEEANPKFMTLDDDGMTLTIIGTRWSLVAHSLLNDTSTFRRVIES